MKTSPDAMGHALVCCSMHRDWRSPNCNEHPVERNNLKSGKPPLHATLAQTGPKAMHVSGGRKAGKIWPGKSVEADSGDARDDDA